MIFSNNSAYHIHRGPTAEKYTVEILRPNVKQHIAYYALADWAALVQDGATPQTAMIRQKAFNNAAIDVLLWPGKSPYINIIKNIWSVISRRINGMNPLRWMTEHHIGVHTTISGQRSTPTSRHCRSSRRTYWLLLNIWMDFRSSHYLHVKFISRLLHSIHVLIHVLKTLTERSI